MAEKTSGKRPVDLRETLTAVARTTLHEQIVAQIQQLIENGSLKNGDQLPPERRLAEIFQVSRHSVREAIRALEQKGVLKSRPGSGTYVVMDDETLVLAYLANAIQIERHKLSEIFEFRRLLEPQITALAAANASASDIDILSGLYEKQARAVGDPEKTGELDQAFHQALARATGNGVLLDIVERLTDILQETRSEYGQSEARRRLSLTGHRNILDAVAARDAEGARRAMTEHLTAIEKVVVPH